MPVDRVRKVGIASHLDDAHAIAFAWLDGDNCDVGGGLVRVATFAIDDGCVGEWGIVKGSGLEFGRVEMEPVEGSR